METFDIYELEFASTSHTGRIDCTQYVLLGDYKKNKWIEAVVVSRKKVNGCNYHAWKDIELNTDNLIYVRRVDTVTRDKIFGISEYIGG